MWSAGSPCSASSPLPSPSCHGAAAGSSWAPAGDTRLHFFLFEVRWPLAIIGPQQWPTVMYVPTVSITCPFTVTPPREVGRTRRHRQVLMWALCPGDTQVPAGSEMHRQGQGLGTAQAHQMQGWPVPLPHHLHVAEVWVGVGVTSPPTCSPNDITRIKSSSEERLHSFSVCAAEASMASFFIRRDVTNTLLQKSQAESGRRQGLRKEPWLLW